LDEHGVLGDEHAEYGNKFGKMMGQLDWWTKCCRGPIPTLPSVDMKRPVQLLVLLGSSRDKRTYWGPNSLPPRTGDRVLQWVRGLLDARSNEKAAAGSPTYEITVFDPKELALPLLDQPTYYYGGPEPAPDKLVKLQAVVEAADAYLIITPEYNHTIPPALKNTMDFFGCSKYANKPSAVLTYSMTEWGGVRAGVALRPMLGELGCLMVSYSLAIPKVNQVLDEHGVLGDEHAEYGNKFGKMMGQLDWYAERTRAHRDASV